MTDERIEQWLHGAGVKFEYLDTCELSEIDIKESLRNQARVSEPLSPEQGMLYKVAMGQGDVFPPVVVHATGKRWVVMDGNNRLDAADKLGWKTWPFGVYVVTEASEQQWFFLTITANKTHGLPSSLKDRAAHAVTMINTFKATIKQAAKALGLTEGYIGTYRGTEKALKRTLDLGIKVIPSDTMLLRLSSIKLDEVFKAAVEQVVEKKFSNDAISDLVKTINAESGQEAMLKVINYEAQRIVGEEKASADIGLKPKKLRTALARAIGVIENNEDSVVAGMSKEQKTDVANLCTKGIARLRAIVRIAGA